jgi:hypothetical protein
LPVTFQASGACSVAGTTVMIVGTGMCQVTASQGGDADWEQAADVIQNTTIDKANASIVVTPYSVTYDGASHTATVVATGVRGEDLSALVSLEGTTHTDAGTYAADPWSFAGGTNYNDASGTVSNRIGEAAQSIAFGPLADRTFGDAPFTVSASGGGSGNPVTFTAAGNCTVSGDLVTLTAAGSCTITASQAGNVNYLPAASVSRSFTIAPAVTPGGPLVNPGPQINQEGDRVELRLVARRVDGDFLASNLPGGLKIDRKGTIRGQIQKRAAAGSPYSVIVSYTAPDGVSSSVAFTWTILRRGPTQAVRIDRDWKDKEGGGGHRR